METESYLVVLWSNCLFSDVPSPLLWAFSTKNVLKVSTQFIFSSPLFPKASEGNPALSLLSQQNVLLRCVTSHWCSSPCGLRRAPPPHNWPPPNLKSLRAVSKQTWLFLFAFQTSHQSLPIVSETESFLGFVSSTCRGPTADWQRSEKVVSIIQKSWVPGVHRYCPKNKVCLKENLKGCWQSKSKIGECFVGDSLQTQNT